MSANGPGPDQVIAATRQWVEEIVVGLNFCPFAKREVVRDAIRYVVCQSPDMAEALKVLMDEVFYLDQHQQSETSLLLYPLGFEEFEHYLELVEMANALLHQGGYAGIYQLATFHPDYVFDGEVEDDPSHYTNRAPYPTLHLIRESSIDRALRTFQDPDSIPVVNMEKARELGVGYFRDTLKRCLQHSKPA